MSALDQEAGNLVGDHTTRRHTDTGDTLIIVFNEQGAILECSPNCESIVGYSRKELISQHISKLVAYLENVPLFVRGEFNPQVGFLSHCGMLFRITHRDGSSFDSSLSIVQLHHLSAPAIRLIIVPVAHEEGPRPGN